MPNLLCGQVASPLRVAQRVCSAGEVQSPTGGSKLVGAKVVWDASHRVPGGCLRVLGRSGTRPLLLYATRARGDSKEITIGWDASHRVPERSTERDAFVPGDALFAILCDAAAGSFEAWDGGAKVTAEGLGGSRMLAPLCFAPGDPGAKERIDLDFFAWPDGAAFAHEGGDWRCEVLELLDEVDAGLGLDEASASGEEGPAVEGPVEDAWEFGEQAIGKAMVLITEEAFGER